MIRTGLCQRKYQTWHHRCTASDATILSAQLAEWNECIAAKTAWLAKSRASCVSYLSEGGLVGVNWVTPSWLLALCDARGNCRATRYRGKLTHVNARWTFFAPDLLHQTNLLHQNFLHRFSVHWAVCIKLTLFCRYKYCRNASHLSWSSNVLDPCKNSNQHPRRSIYVCQFCELFIIHNSLRRRKS